MYMVEKSGKLLCRIVLIMLLFVLCFCASCGHKEARYALDMAETIQRNDFETYGALIGKTWMQNQALDCGTNPPAVEEIISKIKDYTLGYKLPGAGGGGYLYMVAKDPQAALRIREILTQDVPNPRARFVEMALSGTGFQISRS